MNVTIHPTAIVENGAVLEDGVTVDAYAYIGAQVRLGTGTHVMHHGTVDGNTVMGSGNTVHPYAYIGGQTQDLKFKGGNPGLRIGDNNDFREYVTVHCATVDGTYTVVGSNNHLLGYTHIAHDCVLGDGIIISNFTGIAGHVKIGSNIVIGGAAGVHQFCRIGDYSMVGGMARVVQDVPPFMIAEGSPAKTRTINKVGLERHGFDHSMMEQVKTAYKIVFKTELTREQALARLREVNQEDTPIIGKMIAFLEGSERGVC